jgi:hypothetical protein
MNRPEPCPFLPEADRTLDWRHLHQCGSDRGPSFYRRCLEYAQYLWLHATPARSLLAVDRALFSTVSENEPVLRSWPLPYAAISWIITRAPGDLFLGNPRIHYQHLADRVKGPRSQVRSWRAWAGWHIVRAVRPDFEGDVRHPVVPPTLSEVQAGLTTHGIPGEIECWRNAFDASARIAPDGRY